jgi:hypothetical protein
MKKISGTIFLVFLFFLWIPNLTRAALVPCGGEGQPPCQLCHFFVLIDKVIDFFFIDIVIPIAILMTVIGGITFLAAAGEPKKINTAKNILTSVAIGLFLMFAAWLILGLFFNVVGLADWTKNFYKNWQEGLFEIHCQ